jgi:hypothetical protein
MRFLPHPYYVCTLHVFRIRPRAYAGRIRHQDLHCWDTAGRNAHITNRGLDARLVGDGARRLASSPLYRVLPLASARGRPYISTLRGMMKDSVT